MGKIISIALQKGGSGKTTTAQALASTLGFKHKRVLLVDMDIQANLTYSSGVDTAPKSISYVLGGDCTADEAIVKCKYYDIIIADEYLTNVASDDDVTLLKNALAPIRDKYDFIIIDTPPQLGNLLFNSLVASDYVIIPTEPRAFAQMGIASLFETIEAIQKRKDSNLKVLGILLIKYSNRTILNKDLAEQIIEYAKAKGTKVFNATIREGIAVAEAQTVREPLIDYAKSSKPNIDYKAFTTEVLQMIGE